MASEMLSAAIHRRGSSGSTVRATSSHTNDSTHRNEPMYALKISVQASLWIHEDGFSHEEILINQQVLEGSGIEEGSLIEVVACEQHTVAHDFEDDHGPTIKTPQDLPEDHKSPLSHQRSSYLCIARIAPPELIAKQQGLEVSIARGIATTFGFATNSRVTLSLTDFKSWTASHIELSFRDAYLARSDMWRLVLQELVGKTVYTGQKITFVGSMKVTVKSIHVHGRNMHTAYFAPSTVPIFRSEAARYVIFIQMSREMWDFDSEGNGEILFNRVVNGFLPDLFKRWSELEVRHLVSIVLFGRLEYRQDDLSNRNLPDGVTSQTPSWSLSQNGRHRDFYRVVVTDMASAQWTTILDELKKDFRVFLRDISLMNAFSTQSIPGTQSGNGSGPTRITGRPSTALKGNILEAINLASSQFSNDYIDRDLIRTGISTVVITAGTGVFDVDHDLLKLTSETLTNNGIGIDIVCLSKMPLHSVPLLRYQLPRPQESETNVKLSFSSSPRTISATVSHPTLRKGSDSPVVSSLTSTSPGNFSRFLSMPKIYGYGIPQWIDLSYWSPEPEKRNMNPRKQKLSIKHEQKLGNTPFVPRVRMYQLQMMGLMELGMADMAIPYLTDNGDQPLIQRPRQKSDPAQIQSISNMSYSPTLSRKARASVLRPKESDGGLASQARSIGKVVYDMDKYDDSLFHFGPRSSDTKKARKSSQKKVETDRKENIPLPKAPGLVPKSIDIQKKQESEKSSTDIGGASIVNKSVKPQRLSRTISYALRGLAPLKAKAVGPEVNVENAKAQSTAALISASSQDLKDSSASIRAESIFSTDIGELKQSKRHADNQSIIRLSTEIENPSKPISINTTQKHSDLSSLSNSELQAVVAAESDHVSGLKVDGSTRNQPRLQVDEDSLTDVALVEMDPNSIPENRIPFVRNVNASNPLKHNEAPSDFGRWQHLYPRKPRASTVKWRSLCTPASVPLTTEDFPTTEELSTEYIITHYDVFLGPIDEIKEAPETLETLLLEMISLRLAHGYQIVVGTKVAKAAGPGLCNGHNLFDPSKISELGEFLFLSMGNTIQKLFCGEKGCIGVTKYIHQAPQVDRPTPTSQTYYPNIRTILSDEFKERQLLLRGFSEQYPWEMADNHLANCEKQQGGIVRDLRFWRARFVLIPVQLPNKNARPSQHQNEDDEEEIHLLGIRALTQLWQKNRYIAPEGRRIVQTRMGSGKRRIQQNPLEIQIDTMNHSELVATELDKLLQLEESGEAQSTQLLPETEKLERDNSPQKFAQAMQGERGIEIKNRRWHLRLHYNCFHGEEFTNWLLHNVKGIETRDDAVEFGNVLMKEGLFEHVNGRHSFRDGTFFYSLKSEFRHLRLDLRQSWFPGSRQTNRSIPPTPLSDQPSRDISSLTVRSRSGSSLAQQQNSSAHDSARSNIAPTKKKTVSLSKMIRVDVDTRNRSFRHRPEIVNVHYDRFHNPENCYHIELNWLNVTSKLVDDAIITWTNTAEKYGLKLVEVPICEAANVPEHEPFRAPYRIKLASEPPKSITFNNVFYNTTSFAPQPNPITDKHVYQKALLKRFNFVLDLEAASEFPSNVDIQYSWGRLEYRYTQFVHRSGVILAQITDEGDLLLLANRLYNSRFVSSNKDSSSRFDNRKKESTGPPSLRPPLPPSQATNMQASGIIGLNLQSPNPSNNNLNSSANSIHNLTSSTLSTHTHPLNPLQTHHISAAPSHYSSPFSSPLIRATADVLGTKHPTTPSQAQYITPEQIKDELETFCSDASSLDAFYRDVARHTPTQGPRKTGSSSSSLLRPVPNSALGVVGEIPGLELGEAVSAAPGFRRATVAVEHLSELLDSSSRQGSLTEAGSGGGNGIGSLPVTPGSAVEKDKERDRTKGSPWWRPIG